MDKKWTDEQLGLIQTGTSVFQHIPFVIGRILHCDTTEPAAKPKSLEEVKSDKRIAIIIGVVGLSLIWLLLQSHLVWAIILSAVVLFISYAFYTDEFQGTDYFVGENGYAVVGFKYKRSNIIKEEVVQFSDISYMFSSETINMEDDNDIDDPRNVGIRIGTTPANRLKGQHYTGTVYSFHIYGHGRGYQFPLLHKTEGSYKDECPSDPIRPKATFNPYIAEFTFMKILEDQWTSYFYNAHINEAQVGFAVRLKKDEIQENAIILSRDRITIQGTTFDSRNMDRICLDLEKECLTFPKFEKKMFSDSEKEVTATIPLSKVGNRKAFVMFYENFYK